MKAIILAAGRGSRMQSLTDERPKCLVEFRGKPLLQWQIESLRAGGATEIGIVCGYKRELLDDFGDCRFVNIDWASTNMVSSLACAASWLSAEPCIVSYSDIFYEPKAIQLLIGNLDTLAITYDPNWLSIWQGRFENPLTDAETFRLDIDNWVVEIGGKSKTLDEIKGQYMGLLRITPEAWQQIETLRAALDAPTRNQLDMTGLLSRVIHHGHPVRGLAYDGEWGEIDNASDLEAYSSKQHV